MAFQTDAGSTTSNDFFLYITEANELKKMCKRAA